mgnify:CR=1 FL=1
MTKDLAPTAVLHDIGCSINEACRDDGMPTIYEYENEDIDLILAD